ETNEKYCLLHGLEDAKASFDIHNSPLSETAVLGFEYGYSVQSPETLVIWEAQFGDFANVGQVMLDQFISSARAKWGEKSNMDMKDKVQNTQVLGLSASYKWLEKTT